MPSKSGRQHFFMEEVAHNPQFAAAHGIKQSVGLDFEAADKGKKFKHEKHLKARTVLSEQ